MCHLPDQPTTDEIINDHMKYRCVLITVSDIKRSRQFYEQVLDQKVKYDYGENITFHGDFAIHLRSHFKELIGNREISEKANNCELYFEIDDLDPAAERLNHYGVDFVHGVREQPWRQQAMRFYDPDGHMIEIGESLEHLSYRLHREGMEVGKISEIIHMSRDFVLHSIGRFEHY